MSNKSSKAKYKKSIKGKASDARYAQTDKFKATQKRYTHREGYCVYKAIYPSGIYIGSGITCERRRRRLSGKTTIGKTLGEKALEFRVLLTITKDQCRQVEDNMIRLYGIENLLNSRRASV